MAPDTAQWTGPIERGDEIAFGRFYDAWFDRAFAIARSVSRRDESFCLDIVQDAMMRVVKSMRALPTESAVEAWMHRTVLTTTIDRLRSDSRRITREQVVAGRESESSDELDRLVEHERMRWLRAEIDRLPDEDRRLLTARVEDGGTLADAGAAIGVSGNAAHGRLRRIVDRLRGRAGGVT